MIATNKRVPMMAGAAALVLIVAWYFLFWSPQAKNVKKAHAARAAAEQQVSQLQTQVGQLHALVKQIPADNARFAQLEASLPDNPQLDQALNLLHGAATATGVSILNLAPSSPTTGTSGAPGGAPAITLSINTQGSVAQIKAFLSALSTLPRTVVVDKISLTEGTSSGASIVARIFYAGQPTP